MDYETAKAIVWKHGIIGLLRMRHEQESNATVLRMHPNDVTEFCRAIAGRSMDSREAAERLVTNGQSTFNGMLIVRDATVPIYLPRLEVL